ncbi:hypothetical protein AB1N83_013159, partial [Pleurotus pulmonarius]
LNLVNVPDKRPSNLFWVVRTPEDLKVFKAIPWVIGPCGRPNHIRMRPPRSLATSGIASCRPSDNHFRNRQLVL